MAKEALLIKRISIVLLISFVALLYTLCSKRIFQQSETYSFQTQSIDNEYNDFYTLDTINEFIIESGYSDDILESLNYEQRLNLVEVIKNNTGNKLDYSVENITFSNDGVATYSDMISSSDLNISIVTYTHYNSDGKVINVYITYYYRWNIVPFWNNNDYIVYTWNPYIFTYESNSLDYHSQSTYSSCLNNSATSENNEGILGWRMKFCDTRSGAINYGVATFQLNRNLDNNTTTANVYAKYVHIIGYPTIVIKPSIGFGFALVSTNIPSGSYSKSLASVTFHLNQVVAPPGGGGSGDGGCNRNNLVPLCADRILKRL